MAHGIQMADIPTHTITCITITPKGVAAEVAPILWIQLRTPRP